MPQKYQPRSFRPRDKEEAKLVDEAAKKYGSVTEAVIAGLRLAMNEDELSDKLLLAMISKRLGVTTR